MAKESGLGDRLYINQYDHSGDVGAIQTISVTAGEQNVTGINKTAMERLQLLKDGEISYNNFFSDGANGPQALNHTDLETLAQVLYFRGTTDAGYGAGMVANQYQAQYQKSQDGSLLGTINAKSSDGFGLEWGEILDATATVSSSPDTGTAYDLGASHGIDDMAFYLVVSAFDGTNADILIQDDTDVGFSSPTTYGAFTQATGTTYERLAVTGAPERYIRWQCSGTYTSLTFHILAVRFFD